MSLWPLQTMPVRNDTQRASNAAAGWQNVTVTPNASAHTKGSWSQVRSSLLYDTTLLVLRGNGATTTDTARPVLIDIGIGGAGSESVYLANMDVGFHVAGQTWYIPCNIPAGTRLAYRAQANNTTGIVISTEAYGELPAIGGGVPVSTWTTYGADTSASTGTAVTPGDTNVWGSWTSIGTTSQDHDVWIFNPSMGGNAATSNRTYRTQIAFGSSTTDADNMVTSKTHIDGPWFSMNTNENLTRFDVQPTSQHVYYPVPSGSNIYVRASCSSTNATIYITGHGGNI